MHLGVGFWNVFGGFWEAKWSQVGTKNVSKIDLNFGRPNLQKYLIKPIVILCFFDFRGANLGAKTDQKTIKKQKQKGRRSEHRFLIDFGGFWGPGWEAKWSQNRTQKASKKR